MKFGRKQIQIQLLLTANSANNGELSKIKNQFTDFCWHKIVLTIGPFSNINLMAVTQQWVKNAVN